jgi:hypothetical protein
MLDFFAPIVIRERAGLFYFKEVPDEPMGRAVMVAALRSMKIPEEEIVCAFLDLRVRPDNNELHFDAETGSFLNSSKYYIVK